MADYKTIKEASKIVGRHPVSVREFVKRHNIPTKKGSKEGKDTNPYTLIDVERLKQAYSKQSKSKDNSKDKQEGERKDNDTLTYTLTQQNEAFIEQLKVKDEQIKTLQTLLAREQENMRLLQAPQQEEDKNSKGERKDNRKGYYILTATLTVCLGVVIAVIVLLNNTTL